jgi:hypothetical protein
MIMNKNTFFILLLRLGYQLLLPVPGRNFRPSVSGCAEIAAADVFYFRVVVFMDSFHNKPHQIRRFATQIREEDWKFITRPVYLVSGMKKIP